MMPTERGDNGDADETGNVETSDADRWERAGRQAVGQALEEARGDLNDTVWELADGLMTGEDPSPEDVRMARQDLNALHLAIEDLVAPSAGLEPWGGKLPDMPLGAAHKYYHCERAVCEDDDE